MFPGRVVHGHVDSIAPASGQEFALLPPDNATGNFTKVVQRIPVKIALDADNNPPIELRPGMSVIPTIATRSPRPRRVTAAASPAPAKNFRERPEMSTHTALISAPSASRSPSDRTAADPNRASLATWVAVLAAMIGSFMAILNIQITNASLLNIEGGIGTGVDNGSWISTSYLIGEIIGDSADRLSEPGILLPPLHDRQRRAVCGLFGRLCLHARPAVDDRDARPAGFRRRRADPDGVHAGAHQAAEAAAADRAGDVRAVAVTFAPAIGPTIGGYLTENYGWQTIFFVNVIPTAVMVVALYLTLERAADAARAPEAGRLGRHRHHGDRPVGAADRARGRQQGRLVLLAVHRAARDRRGWSACRCSS